MTANQVDLKKAVLTVGETGRKREIFARLRRNCRHAVRVADDGRRSLQCIHYDCAIQLRQACTNREPRKHDYQYDERACARNQSQQEFLHRISGPGRDFDDFHRIGAAGHSVKITLREYDAITKLDELIFQQSLEYVLVQAA